jgi:hypothetical protein
MQGGFFSQRPFQSRLWKMGREPEARVQIPRGSRGIFLFKNTHLREHGAAGGLMLWVRGEVRAKLRISRSLTLC